jgi:hypothetical protein
MVKAWLVEPPAFPSKVSDVSDYVQSPLAVPLPVNGWTYRTSSQIAAFVRAFPPSEVTTITSSLLQRTITGLASEQPTSVYFSTFLTDSLKLFQLCDQPG